MAGRQYLPPFCLFLILFSNGYSIIIRPNSLLFIENSNISVNCEAEQLQGETNFISLFVDSVDIVTLPRYFSASGVLGNVTYLFGPVNRSDNGSMFECRNGGSASRSLNVLIPAKFVTEPNSNYTGTREGNLTIGVTDEGDGTVIRTLTKDSGPVRAGVILTESSVVFTDLKCSDAGMYALRISNGIGQGATATFELSVTGTPANVSDAGFSISGEATVNFNVIVDICPAESLFVMTCETTEGIAVTVKVTVTVGQVMLTLTAKPVPRPLQTLNLKCIANEVYPIVFSVTQSYYVYCDTACIAGIVVAVIVLLLALIATIFIILCCCCCDCCKGKKKTKPERFSNKGQELS